MKKKLLFFSISAVLAISTILATVDSFAGGIEMNSLNKKESKLIAEKKDLEESLVKTSSSRELATKSSELGFEKISEVFYLTKIDTVAQAR